MTHSIQNTCSSSIFLSTFSHHLTLSNIIFTTVFTALTCLRSVYTEKQFLLILLLDIRHRYESNIHWNRSFFVDKNTVGLLIQCLILSKINSLRTFNIILHNIWCILCLQTFDQDFWWHHMFRHEITHTTCNKYWQYLWSSCSLIP